MNTFKRSMLTLLVAAVLGSQALAQEPAEAPEMDSEQQAMMQAWMEAGMPGDPHAMLADQAGNWTAEMEIFMDPDAPPATTTYQVERSMEMDGRVLNEEWSGEWMGMEFHGKSRTGYDNVKEQYWSTWSDNMSTALMVSHGSRHEDGSIHLAGSYPDPMTGKTIQSRFVWTFPDENTERMEAFETHEGKDEFMNMRMTLTRSDG